MASEEQNGDLCNASLAATPLDCWLKFAPLSIFYGESPVVDRILTLDNSGPQDHQSFLNCPLSFRVFVPRLETSCNGVLKIHTNKGGNPYKFTITFDSDKITSGTVKSLWWPFDLGNTRDNPMLTILFREIRYVKCTSESLTLFVSNKQKVMFKITLLEQNYSTFIFSDFECNFIRHCFPKTESSELCVLDPMLYLPGYKWTAEHSQYDPNICYFFMKLYGHSFWSKPYDDSMGQSFFYDSLHKDIKHLYGFQLTILAHNLMDEMELEKPTVDNISRCKAFVQAWSKFRQYYPVDVVSNWDDYPIALNFSYQMIYFSISNFWGQLTTLVEDGDKLSCHFISPMGREDKVDIIYDAIAFYEVMCWGGNYSLKIRNVTVQKFLVIRSPSAELHDSAMSTFISWLEKCGGHFLLDMQHEDFRKLIQPITSAQLEYYCKAAFTEKTEWPLYGSVPRRFAHRTTQGHLIYFDSNRCAVCSVSKSCKELVKTLANRIAIKIVCMLGDTTAEMDSTLQDKTFSSMFEAYKEIRDKTLQAWHGSSLPYMTNANGSIEMDENWLYGLFDYRL